MRRLPDGHADKQANSARTHRHAHCDAHLNFQANSAGSDRNANRDTVSDANHGPGLQNTHVYANARAYQGFSISVLPDDRPHAAQFRRKPAYDEKCLRLIGTIIQHESGGTLDYEVYRFMADQVYYDALRIGCANLIAHRWAIKSLPAPNRLVMSAVRDPLFYYPKCQFIGMDGDLDVWRAYGYNTRVDYHFLKRGLHVNGVNCNRTKVLYQKVPN